MNVPKMFLVNIQLIVKNKHYSVTITTVDVTKK